MRGHDLIYNNKRGKVYTWKYKDTGEEYDDSRPCKKCGKLPTDKGHDACISNLPGVVFACCGHGNINNCYVILNDGVTRYSGKKAKEYINKILKEVK